MKTMAYELSGSTKVKDVRGAKRWHINKELENVSTGRIVLYLIVRHKYQLLIVWASYATIQLIFPPFNDIVLSIVQSVF